MAFSSLKASSLRETHGYSTKPSSSAAKEQSCVEPQRKKPLRRSTSVSAVSRSDLNGAAAAPAAKKASVGEFLNKRDNPLFLCSSSSSLENEASKAFFELGGDVSSSSRGRSGSRSSANGDKACRNRSQSARIFSRVCCGRLIRSASTEHFGYSLSKEEKDCRKSSRLKIEDKRACATLVGCDVVKQTKNLQTCSSKHSVSRYSNALSAKNWGDVISTSSLSEVEERTIREHDRRSAGVGVDYLYETFWAEVQRAVSEIRRNLEKAMKKNNTVEIPPELVNLEAVDLVIDPSAEYEAMLKESQERVRKLRADLASEERHEQEINRFLEGMTPVPDDTCVRQSPRRRKLSNERLRMSEQLEEDAINYFDECVSISTFDGSDLSSSDENHPLEDLNPKKLSDVGEKLDGIGQSSSSACETMGSEGLFLDLRNYVQFENGALNSSDKHVEHCSNFNMNGFGADNTAESLLLDSVMLRNRIESGSLLLCHAINFWG